MDLSTLAKGDRVTLSDDRAGVVLDVFPTVGKKRKPRVVVALDNKPSMAVKVAASNVVSQG